MAASSFVLCLSLVLLATTLGCSAQLGDEEPALISTLQALSNSTVESLRLHRQNTAALSNLQSLPDMLQLMKEQMERNMGSMKKELAGLNKEAENTLEIQDLKPRLEDKDEQVTTLTQEIQDLRAQLEARSQTVEQLTEFNAEIMKKNSDNNEQVQDLNNRLQESELQVQQLNNTLQKINQTMECKEKDTECRHPQLQKIQDVVQRFNSSKDLKQLWDDLESSLDFSNVEYQQLRDVLFDDHFTLWLGKSGHIELVTLLLCAGLPVDMADSDGHNMLYGALESGQVQMVKFLLQHGAQLEARAGWQYTPLIWMAYNGHLEAVKVLVEAGANTTARDEQGRTALEAARFNIRTDTVQYLQPLPH